MLVLFKVLDWFRLGVTLSTAAANLILDTLVDLLDVGAGSNGTIDWCTAADAVLCSTDLAEPAFDDAAAKSVPLLGVPLTSDGATAGTVAKALFKDEDATEVFRLTVGTSGAEINLSGVVLGTSETITLNSLALTA